jgi:hypothetical protein
VAENARRRRAFERYWRLGADRSIEKLHGALAADGRAPCLRTLYEWSRRYGWQAEVAKLEREAERADRAQRVRDLREMKDRQAKLGLLLQQKGAEGLVALSASQLPATVAVRAITEGVRLEREARGLASDGRGKNEVVTEVHEVHLCLGGSQEEYMYPVDEAE